MKVIEKFLNIHESTLFLCTQKVSVSLSVGLGRRERERMWIGDFIFEENKTRLNNREKGWNPDKEEKHCIYRREKKEKNVIEDHM